jgi:hypothetical protein
MFSLTSSQIGFKIAQRLKQKVKTFVKTLFQVMKLEEISKYNFFHLILDSCLLRINLGKNQGPDFPRSLLKEVLSEVRTIPRLPIMINEAV